MKRSLTLICSLLFFGFTGLSYAQSVNRVEIEAKKVADDYTVIPIGKDGLIMFYESKEKASGGNKIWIFSRYDTDFKEVWTKEFPIQRNLDYINFDYNQDNLYLFLGKSTQPKSKNENGSTRSAAEFVNNKGDFEIVSLNFNTGDIKNTSGEIPFGADVSQNFSVINNHAFISGKSLATAGQVCLQGCLTCTFIPWITQYTTFHFEAVLFDVDLTTGTSRQIKNPEFKGNTYVMEADKAADGSGMDFIFKNKPGSEKPTTFYLKRYSEKGDELTKTTIQGDKKEELVTSRVLNLNDVEQILIGTYKTATPPKKYFNPGSEKAMAYGTDAEGMFFSKINGGSQKYIKYYSFKDFKRFYELATQYGVRKMSERQKEKLDKKLADENYILKYRLLVHEIIVKNDQYIMVAEAYFPQYHTETYQVYVPGNQTQTRDAQGNTTTHTTLPHYETHYRTVFDGFRFTHAIVAGFDKEGNKIWDNSFEIEDILAPKLTQMVRVMPGDNETVMVYALGGSIKSKVISGNTLVDGKTSTKIDTGKEGDKVKGNAENSIEYWYDNYFVSFGYQRIKNDDAKKGEEKRRRVYYFNKIAYQ